MNTLNEQVQPSKMFGNKSSKDTNKKAREVCSELKALPKDWDVDFENDDLRAVFTKGSQRTWHHPTFPKLPTPWYLKIITRSDGTWNVWYYNPYTREQTMKDPRYTDENLRRVSNEAPREHQTSSSSRRNRDEYGRPLDLNNFKRAPIRDDDYSNDFELVHVIDDGQGLIGGMNGGVFVVRLKNVRGARLQIEKKFPDTLPISCAREEIGILRKVRHDAMTSYLSAFIIENGPTHYASLYMEFCDRGSLKDLIMNYCGQRNDRPYQRVPEEFAWHIFGSLLDGLAFLQMGVSLAQYPDSQPGIVPDWVPILHRDIKPDNILLKSRSTVGSKKYPYCVLSDFGLACYDFPNGHPKQNDSQSLGGVCGTCAFWAPELCHNPLPRTPLEVKTYPNNFRHSKRSDLWALGACIYNLCNAPNSLSRFHDCSHLDWEGRGGMAAGLWVTGQEARRRKGTLTISPRYSRQLRTAVEIATTWAPGERPSPYEMAGHFRELLRNSGAKAPGPPLPEWATRVHEYYGKAERNSR